MSGIADREWDRNREIKRGGNGQGYMTRFIRNLLPEGMGDYAESVADEARVLFDELPRRDHDIHLTTSILCEKFYQQGYPEKANRLQRLSSLLSRYYTSAQLARQLESNFPSQDPYMPAYSTNDYEFDNRSRASSASRYDNRYSTPTQQPFGINSAREDNNNQQPFFPNSRRPNDTPPDGMSVRSGGTMGGGGIQPLSEIASHYKPQADPSEYQILQTLPYTLLGSTSAIFPFSSDGKTIEIPDTISYPQSGILHKLFESALLYRQLQNVKSTTSNNKRSQVRIAFNSALQEELEGYVRIVNDLAVRIQQQLSSDLLMSPKITVLKCLLELKDETVNLRLQYTLLQSTQELKAGEFLSKLYDMASNGDYRLSDLSIRLLNKSAEPYYRVLNKWLSSGDLDEKQEEFFIKRVYDESQQRLNIHNNNRRHKYTSSLDRSDRININELVLSKSDAPCYFSSALLDKIFHIGKNLSFLKYNCNELKWANAHTEKYINQFSRFFKTEGLYSRNFSQFDKTVNEDYKDVMARLNEIVFNKFKLNLHLNGLRDYLLLRKGDFIHNLIEISGDILDAPASSLSTHQLTRVLEDAKINTSSCRYGNNEEVEEVLNSLDARVLELSHGGIGWDVFTLDYHVPAPLDFIINKQKQKEYLKIFNFLWKLKRVEVELGLQWREIITTSGAKFIRTPPKSRRSNNNNSEFTFITGFEKQIIKKWRRSNVICFQIIQFITEIQCYFEQNLSSAWSMLQKSLMASFKNRIVINDVLIPYNQPPCDISDNYLTIDDFLLLHGSYLDEIINKGLLQDDNTGLFSKEEFKIQLHWILNLITNFYIGYVEFYSLLMELNNEKRINKTTTSKNGVFNGINDMDIDIDMDLNMSSGMTNNNTENRLKTVAEQLTQVETQFMELFEKFNFDLLASSDQDLKYLGMRLNGNGFFKLKKNSYSNGRGKIASKG